MSCEVGLKIGGRFAGLAMIANLTVRSFERYAKETRWASRAESEVVSVIEVHERADQDENVAKTSKSWRRLGGARGRRYLFAAIPKSKRGWKLHSIP